MISTVLIVEDETILAITLKQIFQSLGIHVVGMAASYSDAVSKTLDLHPDLIVMDINLASDETGVDAAETIRNFSVSPIVFQSSTLEPDLISRAENCSNSTFLRKTTSRSDWSWALQYFDAQPVAMVA